MIKHGKWVSIRAIDKFVRVKFPGVILSKSGSYDIQYARFLGEHIISGKLLIEDTECCSDNPWLHPLLVVDYARRNDMPSIEYEIYDLLDNFIWKI
jgi:hypothetical protein